jgi:hypothetical protein
VTLTETIGKTFRTPYGTEYRVLSTRDEGGGRQYVEFVVTKPCEGNGSFPRGKVSEWTFDYIAKGTDVEVKPSRFTPRVAYRDKGQVNFRLSESGKECLCFTFYPKAADRDVDYEVCIVSLFTDSEYGPAVMAPGSTKDDSGPVLTYSGSLEEFGHEAPYMTRSYPEYEIPERATPANLWGLMVSIARDQDHDAINPYMNLVQEERGKPHMPEEFVSKLLTILHWE